MSSAPLLMTYTPPLGEPIPLSELPLSAISSVATCSKRHKQSKVTVFRSINNSYSDFLAVRKVHHIPSTGQLEVAVLGAFAKSIVEPGLCLHLPEMLAAERFAVPPPLEETPPETSTITSPKSKPRTKGKLIEEQSEKTLWMPWYGFDARSAAENGWLRTTSDLYSAYLQILWTCMTVEHYLNLRHYDLHLSNCLVQHAPFGGHYLMRFVLADRDKYHVVTLRSRIYITISDWGSCGRSSFVLPVNKGLMSSVFGDNYPVRSSSSSQQKKRARSRSRTHSVAESFPPTYSTVAPLIGKLWEAICEKVVSAKGSRVTVRGRDIPISQLPNATESAGSYTWFETANALVSEHLSIGEYIRVETNFPSGIPAKGDRSLNTYTQREYMQWVNLAMSPLPETKKRGRQCIYGPIPLTPAERQRLHYLRKKRKRQQSNISTTYEKNDDSSSLVKMDVFDDDALEPRIRKKRPILADSACGESSNTEMHVISLTHLLFPKELGIAVPIDSSMVVVRSSKLDITGTGLGVFAAVQIPNKTTITSYSGLHDINTTAFERMGWQKTHLHCLSRGASGNVIDGIRFPQAEKGVASLVNSSRGMDIEPNVSLVKFSSNVLPAASVHLVAIRDIAAGEELLADYKVLGL